MISVRSFHKFSHGAGELAPGDVQNDLFGLLQIPAKISHGAGQIIAGVFVHERDWGFRPALILPAQIIVVTSGQKLFSTQLWMFEVNVSVDG